MSQTRVIRLLSLTFAVACGAALVACFWRPLSGPEGAQADGAEESSGAALAVAWRVPAGPRAGRPCAVAEGWVVADGAGGVTKVSASGRVLWRAAFSNEAFAGAGEAGGGRVAVASESGRVFALDGATGAELWRRETGARFQHAPLAGMRGAEPALWLVSQEDGRLFCLRAADGTVLWTTEPTNRCDGEPAAWPGRIAYGNCDGAVYVFDSVGGKRLGTIEVGEEDQMAGGILALKEGRLVTGTRSGKLVLINPHTFACESAVKISESEAFLTPVALAGGLVAMGADEGTVTLWRCEQAALQPAAQIPVGAAVRSLAGSGGRGFAMAGGTLVAFSREREFARLALGDDVGPLSMNGAGDLACVADGALVCVKGGRE